MKAALNETISMKQLLSATQNYMIAGFGPDNVTVGNLCAQ